MISMDKKYRTKDGRQVRLYAVDGVGPYCVHGAVKICETWYAREWTDKGIGNCSDFNLIEVVMIPEYWVVFNENGVNCYVVGLDPSSVIRSSEFTIHHPAQEKPNGTQ